VNPAAFATSSRMSSTAAPPSVSGEAFPAVTVPYARSKTGESLASCAAVVSARIPLSATIGDRVPRSGKIGRISAASRPSAVPAAAP